MQETLTRVIATPSPSALRDWSFGTWLHWILRIGVLCEFVGHGAFGIMGKEAWLPYFHVFGIPDSWAWTIMPVVGIIDVSVGVLTLVRPMRAVLVYATFWTTMTALLRPLAGQGVWEEVFERAGNFGLPLALLVLVGLGNGTLRSWFEHARPLPLTEERARVLSWVLRVVVAALLIGHGGFGLSHLHDREWTSYFGVLGVGPDTIASWPIIAVVAWFEVALGLAVLVKPARGLVLGVLLWKLGTELLRPLAGEPVWEFVERGGDYFLPLALLLVQRWLGSQCDSDGAVPPDTSKALTMASATSGEWTRSVTADSRRTGARREGVLPLVEPAGPHHERRPSPSDRSKAAPSCAESHCS